MRITLSLLGVVGIAAWAFCAPDGKHNDATGSYTQTNVEGWKVYVSHRLEAEVDLSRDVMEELRIQLSRVRHRLPTGACEKLREVPIWMELNNSPGAQYHPSAEWLGKHHYNPAKAKGIEVGDAREFVTWARRRPVMAMLHELAHAYHDRVLGFDHPDIIRAYQQAVDKKLYERVLRDNGQTERHYALTDAKEFFAEASEAYFWQNDFYPFLRAELKHHDPATHDLLARLWGE